jgi:Domain of unknown function (DUF4390)
MTGAFRGVMALRHRQTYCTLLVCLLVLAPSGILAKNPTLNHIAVSNTNDDLLLHLSLEGAFSEKIKRNILSGNPTSFSFIVHFNHVRDLWFDEQIAQIEVWHTITYDNAKKEFSVRRSWRSNDAEVTSSFEEARQWMTQIENLKIIPLGRMDKGSQYQLRTKAEVSKKTLPLNLQQVLFFLSFWDEETDWYIIDFAY